MSYTADLTPIQGSAITEDEKARVVAEMREKAQADYESAMANQREEGRQEAFNKVIIMMLKNGKGVEEIAKDMDISIEKIKELEKRL